MRAALSAACVAAVLLSACVPVVKRTMLRDELREAGFPPAQAQCLSDRIAPRLSVAELRALGRTVDAAKESLRTLPVPLAMARIVEAADPRILGVVIEAGVACITTFAPLARPAAR